MQPFDCIGRFFVDIAIWLRSPASAEGPRQALLQLAFIVGPVPTGRPQNRPVGTSPTNLHPFGPSIHSPSRGCVPSPTGPANPATNRARTGFWVI